MIILITACLRDGADELPDFVQGYENLTILDNQGSSLQLLTPVKEIAFSDSLILDEIVAIVVDENGDVYHTGKAWNRNEVYQFNSDGERVATYSGPNDSDERFSDIQNIRVQNNQLIVFDNGTKTVHFINTEDGTLIKSQSLDFTLFSDLDLPDQYDIIPFLINNDSVVVKVRDTRNPSYHPERFINYYSIEPGQSDNPKHLFSQRDMTFMIGDYAGRPAPFVLSKPERPLLAYSKSGSFYTAQTENFFIKQLNKDGEFQRSYYMPFERAELDRDRVIHPRFSHNDQILRVRESAEYPAKWPALYSMLIDDKNRLWVSTITDSEETLTWFVIDNEEIIASFDWPFQNKIREITNGFIYAEESNSSGFKEVVRYRISDSGI